MRELMVGAGQDTAAKAPLPGQLSLDEQQIITSCRCFHAVHQRYQRLTLPSNRG
jgi:hypothetical protein